MPTLRVPIREAVAQHVQQRARGAMQQIAFTLMRARILARARVQIDQQGRPRVTVYVQGPGALNARLMLKEFIDGIRVIVV